MLLVEVCCSAAGNVFGKRRGRHVVAWAELESKSFAEARAETLGTPQIGCCQTVGRQDLDRGRAVRGGGARGISTRLDDPLPISAVALDICQLCGLSQRRKRVCLQSQMKAFQFERSCAVSRASLLGGINGERMAARVHSDSAMHEEMTFQGGTENSTKR